MAPAASHFQPEITPIPDRLAPGPGSPARRPETIAPAAARRPARCPRRPAPDVGWPDSRQTLHAPPPLGNPRGYIHRSRPAQTAPEGRDSERALGELHAIIGGHGGVGPLRRVRPSSRWRQSRCRIPARPVGIAPFTAVQQGQGRAAVEADRNGPGGFTLPARDHPDPGQVGAVPGISSVAAWVRAGVSSSTPRQRRSTRVIRSSSAGCGQRIDHISPGRARKHPHRPIRPRRPIRDKVLRSAARRRVEKAQ